MRIAVNTRLLIKNKLDGIGWFTYETLKRITAQHKEIEFIFIFDRPYSNEFIFSSNITPIVIGPQARHPILWYIWFEKSIPKILKKYKADLFLSPDGYLSMSTNIPSIAVIHDINFYHRPKDIPFLARKYYMQYFPKYAKKAARLGTVSNYSKNDIINCFNVNPDKVDVIYNGANEEYRVISNNEINLTKKKYTKGCDYFLFIGNLHPRKNVGRLIKAFNGFKQETGKNDKLIIVGEVFFKTKEIKEALNNCQFKNDIIFIGRQSPEELKLLLGAATALTFVPLFEGFGIPNLEAMYCGIPVISSNTTAIPEIVGDAGILVDPLSIEEIKNAMINISKDSKLSDELIRNGSIRKQLYTWDNAADNLWNCIKKCMG